MGKKCDLCDGVARMYCESDQASLCWSCDGKVHGANFLVAKHTRCLLCSACQSPTPWKATGLRLGPTFSVCDSCAALKSAAGGGGGLSSDRVLSDNRSQQVNGLEQEEDRLRLRDDDVDSAESYDDDEDEDEDEEYSDEDEDDVDDDEEAENQVVPWAAAAAAQPPPMMSSSSSDGGGGDLVAKRTRDFSDDEIGCSSAQGSNYSRPLKRLSRDEPTVGINSLVRLEGERTLNGAVDSSPSSSSTLIFAISKRRRNLSL